MARLSEREKHEIVTLLARYHSHAQVVVVMRDRWGVTVDRFQVRGYDPTNPRYEAAGKWRAIFEAARAGYLSNLQNIPIAHPAYRLNELQKNYERAAQAGNLPLANAILKQAAWEVGRVPQGESYPGQRESSRLEDLSDEEKDQRLAALFDRALAHEKDQIIAN